MNHTALDSIGVGDYIVVYDFAQPERHTSKRSPFHGEPLLVTAVDLPFIAVFDQKDTHGIDTRYYTVRRCTHDYAGAHGWPVGTAYRHQQHAEQKAKDRAKRRGNRPLFNDGYKRCHDCGAKLRQKALAGGPWRWVCPDCEWDGGIVEVDDR